MADSRTRIRMTNSLDDDDDDVVSMVNITIFLFSVRSFVDGKIIAVH